MSRQKMSELKMGSWKCPVIFFECLAVVLSSVQMPGLTTKDQVQDLRKEEEMVSFDFWIFLAKSVPAKAVCLYCSLTLISLASLSLQCLVLFIKLQLPDWHSFAVRTLMPKNKGKIKQWIQRHCYGNKILWLIKVYS